MGSGKLVGGLNSRFRVGKRMRFELRREATAAQTALRRIVGNGEHMREIRAPAAGFPGADHGRIALGAEGLHFAIILYRTVPLSAIQMTEGDSKHRAKRWTVPWCEPPASFCRTAGAI